MTMTAPEPPRPASVWEVIPLTHNSWRICDAALMEADASRLVAYIDRNESGHFDVLWLRSPCPTRSRYRSMDELLAELDAAQTADTPSRSTRPTHIPHFPPTH
ncbi:hypothetical protein [Microbacterium sp.]|uniref:hypothetical protein n=1 Tax=Microbacterium sp. TaxID=51671 RepID=UPI003A919189